MPYNTKEKLNAYVERTRERKRELDRSYSERHREEAKARAKAWYDKNKERAKATNRKWRTENADKMREYRQKWKSSNPLKDKESKSRYLRTEKGKVSKANKAHRRRERFLENRSPITNEQMMIIRSAKTCFYCGIRSRRMEIDHMVPLAKGGAHSKDNIVMACGPCNRAKSAKDPNEFARSRGLLFVV